MPLRFIRNPMTRKRLARFREIKRAYFSFWILAVLYLLSLCAEVICNDVPLMVRFNGGFYLPVFRFYPEDSFTGNGRLTRPDYKRLNASPSFTKDPDNFMVFPPVPFGPDEIIDPATIHTADAVHVILRPMPRTGSIDIDPELRIRRAISFSMFIPGDERVENLRVSEFYPFPDSIRNAIAARFRNEATPAVSALVKGPEGRLVNVSLSPFRPRAAPPETVRVLFREPESAPDMSSIRVTLAPGDVFSPTGPIWESFSPTDLSMVKTLAAKRFEEVVDSVLLTGGDRRYRVSFEKEEVRFPYDPTPDHPMGIDGAGRDVFARVLYGFRTSLTFGMLLVICSTVFGILAGAVQGYYGGLVDITGQRLIEIWSALPFLYIMILMGSVYGRSFSLLLFCYGIFNWIGISYYIRAEFLRLRKQPFVEAAVCMGLSTFRIMNRHILPNALVPVITFFPFSLVGAIGSLAALDYLGFGLPPPAASWGELLFQAQQYRWAWWLILYPSLALFIVMLLGVFVGEGIRNAYDPRRFAEIE